MSEPNRSYDSLVREFVELSSRMMTAMHKHPQESFPSIDLTLQQAHILALLQERPARMGEITARSGCSLSSVSALVDRLVEKGFIERSQSAEDRRVVMCSLTAAGRSEIESLWRVSQVRLEKLARMMDVDELDTMIRATQIMVDVSERMAEKGVNS